MRHDAYFSCKSVLENVHQKIGLDRTTLTEAWVTGRSIKIANTSCMLKRENVYCGIAHVRRITRLMVT